MQTKYVLTNIFTAAAFRKGCNLFTDVLLRLRK